MVCLISLILFYYHRERMDLGRGISGVTSRRSTVKISSVCRCSRVWRASWASWGITSQESELYAFTFTFCNVYVYICVRMVMCVRVCLCVCVLVSRLVHFAIQMLVSQAESLCASFHIVVQILIKLIHLICLHYNLWPSSCSKKACIVILSPKYLCSCC